MKERSVRSRFVRASKTTTTEAPGHAMMNDRFLASCVFFGRVNKPKLCLFNYSEKLDLGTLSSQTGGILIADRSVLDNSKNRVVRRLEE